MRRENPEIAHLGRLQDRRDQEDGVGAVGRRFDHVQFVDGEILAQNRDRDGRAGRFEIGQIAREKFPIREDAERGGSAGGIHLGNRRRAIVVCESSLAGRGFLDFRNNTGRVRGQRGLEIARGSANGGAALQLRAVAGALRERGTLVTDNFSENIWNRDCHEGEFLW